MWSHSILYRMNCWRGLGVICFNSMPPSSCTCVTDWVVVCAILTSWCIVTIQGAAKFVMVLVWFILSDGFLEPGRNTCEIMYRYYIYVSYPISSVRARCNCHIVYVLLHVQCKMFDVLLVGGPQHSCNLVVLCILIGFRCHVVVGFGTYLYFKMCGRIVFYIVMDCLRCLGVVVSVACIPVAVSQAG